MEEMLLNSIPGKKANVLLGDSRLTQTKGAFICLSSVGLKSVKLSFQKHLLISGFRAKMKGSTGWQSLGPLGKQWTVTVFSLGVSL